MLNEQSLKQLMGVILEVAPETIDENSSMDNIKSWDSLKHMNLVLAIEEEFGISIPDEEAANVTSYKLIRIVVEELLKG